MKVTFFNKTVEIKEGTRLIDLLDESNKKKYYAAYVDNRLRELDYILPNKDSNIEFLDLSNQDAVMLYQNTLRYIFAMAVNRLYKKVKVVFNYSVSRAIFANISGINGPVNQKEMQAIQNEMDSLIKQDLPIKRFSTTIEEAKKIYNNLGYYDKSNMLDYRSENTVHMYKCENYLNYMFGYMLPSTGYLTKFALRLYFPGLIMQYPRAELNGEIPEFKDEKVFSKALR
jgi:uridine kinase